MKVLLSRTIVFAFWTFVRFMLIIGVAVFYFWVTGQPVPDRVPGDIEMLILRVMPATAAGHVLALGLLWWWRGRQGIVSAKQSALAALLCAVILDSAYLFGTPFMSGMVLRRSVHLLCALIVTLALGVFWGAKPAPVATDGVPGDAPAV